MGVGKICDIQPIRRWLSATDLDFVLLGFQTCTVAVVRYRLR